METIKVPTSPSEMGFSNFIAWRDYQKEIVEFVLGSSKKFVMLDAPTGSGKSIIGMVLSRLLKKSIYCCTTKILQDQLTKDFPDIPILKGRSNYPCFATSE